MKRTRKGTFTTIGIVISLLLVISLVLGGDLQRQNREGLARDLTTLALRAQDYYRKAIWEGGGGGTFDGLVMSKLTAKPVTPNGELRVEDAYGNVLRLIATGTQRGNDGQLLLVVMEVFPDSTQVLYCN